jgi:hypothetical protein
MTPERKPSSSADAGTNPTIVPSHLGEDVPYDKTALGEVYDENHELDTGQLQAVQTGEYWSPRPPARELPQPKSKKGLFIAAIGGTVTAGLLAGGVAFGLNANNNNHTENTPQPNPNTASAPVTPGAQETKQTAQNQESLEIKAGQTPEALARNYIKLVGDWAMANANQATYQDYHNHLELTVTEYARKIAETEGVKRAKELFGDDYASDSSKMTYVQNMIDANAVNLELYLRTAKNNITAEQTYVFDKVISSQANGDETNIVIAAHVDNNSAETSQVTSLTPSGQKIVTNITLKKYNDNIEHLLTAHTSAQ